MGVLSWLSTNWLDFLQSIGIISGFVFTAHTIRREAEARKIANLLSQGTLDTLLVHPREVFKSAISGGLICEKLAMDRSLRKTFAHHGHCPAISFEEEIRAFRSAALEREFQCKNAVWNDTEFHAARKIDLPLKWRVHCVVRKHVLWNQPNVTGSAAGQFKCYHHLGNEQGMLQEHSADRPVLFGPPKDFEIKTKLLFQQYGTFAA